MTRQARPSSEKIIASHLGHFAQGIVSTPGTAILMGNTSRGIFLKSRDKWVLFLSYEVFRGPLTVNIKGNFAVWRQLTTEERFLISPNRITASNGNISISLAEALPWQVTVPEHQQTSLKDSLHRLHDFAQQAYTQKKDAGLSSLIPLMLRGQSSHPQAENLLTLLSAFQDNNSHALSHSLSTLLGLGGGLTPSWDDFTLGLLLTLNRWEQILEPTLDLEQLNATLIESAYTKTTTISANLIECATLGQADERLIDTLDYIMTGMGKEIQILEGLLSWGNSSGIDALLGMMVGCTKYQA
jgi:hypothetical protein